ncbi:hypothetical protein BT96DRAFT_979604 [Gymnopus androsaceus JB14]|uniref:Uncharacterized protein n=1 Tax=Gymnopus androsaceus JB14 TaxID=1447944 RepID=A0A6A4H2S4_9AGAR|nr:hypothetical protein BT96DRAFT_979604 [Gymnopus androsaceus JB14]
MRSSLEAESLEGWSLKEGGMEFESGCRVEEEVNKCEGFKVFMSQKARVRTYQVYCTSHWRREWYDGIFHRKKQYCTQRVKYSSRSTYFLLSLLILCRSEKLKSMPQELKSTPQELKSMPQELKSMPLELKSMLPKAQEYAGEAQEYTGKNGFRLQSVQQIILSGDRDPAEILGFSDRIDTVQTLKQTYLLQDQATYTLYTASAINHNFRRIDDLL